MTKMATSVAVLGLVLVLVASCTDPLVAADSTIQNAADQPVLVDGSLLFVGQIRTVSIAAGKSSGSVNLAHARNVTGVQIRNSREYFVIDNQTGTGIVSGRRVRTLDLVEGRKVQNSF